MSSRPTLIMNPTGGEEVEEMLAIDQGRSHTSSPRSRSNSRLEALIMEMTRSIDQQVVEIRRGYASEMAGANGRCR